MSKEQELQLKLFGFTSSDIIDDLKEFVEEELHKLFNSFKKDAEKSSGSDTSEQVACVIEKIEKDFSSELDTSFSDFKVKVEEFLKVPEKVLHKMNRLDESNLTNITDDEITRLEKDNKDLDALYIDAELTRIIHENTLSQLNKLEDLHKNENVALENILKLSKSDKSIHKFERKLERHGKVLEKYLEVRRKQK